jgi:hypothetical protein
MKDQALRSSILTTGAKFEVTEDSTDGTYGAGTTGFICYVKGKDRDFTDVWFMRAIITRRGKGGKTRFDEIELSCPVFDLSKENEHFVKIMPDEKRKYYVHITPAPTIANLMEYDDVDFIGWAVAYSSFLNKLSGRARHFNPWPQESDHILNKLLNISDYWAEDSEYCLYNFAATEAREDIIGLIRKMESGLVRCALVYMHRVADIEVSALNFLVKTLPDGAIDIPLKQLSQIVSDYSAKAEALKKLAAGKRSADMKWA